MTKTADEAPTGSRRTERDESIKIEAYSSPKTRYADENAGVIFSATLFCLTLGLSLFFFYAIIEHIDMLDITISLALATMAIFTIRIASQWEKIVILRFGKYSRTKGPGLYITIPFVDHIALKADQRVQITGFSAEETLTSDLVPTNVNAVIFWMVWDAKKACMEVEDYYDSVALAAQTTLRDTIGRKSITDVISHRAVLDEELKDAIAEKTETWGVSVLSVEIRDIVLPKYLQEDMSAEARAERERDARMVLAEIEKDIASMLHEASGIYRDDPIAFKLRQMHLLNEGIKQTNGTMIVPSAYTEGFTAELDDSAQHTPARTS